MRKVTPVFVPYGGFETTKDLILAHVDFAIPAKDGVISLKRPIRSGQDEDCLRVIAHEPGGGRPCPLFCG